MCHQHTPIFVYRRFIFVNIFIIRVSFIIYFTPLNVRQILLPLHRFRGLFSERRDIGEKEMMMMHHLSYIFSRRYKKSVNTGYRAYCPATMPRCQRQADTRILPKHIPRKFLAYSIFILDDADIFEYVGQYCLASLHAFIYFNISIFSRISPQPARLAFSFSSLSGLISAQAVTSGS